MSIRVDRGAGCGGASWCSWKEVSAKRGGNVIRAGRGCLVKEWQRKKKRQLVWRFLSKIQKKCFHSELPTTNRLTIPD